MGAVGPRPALQRWACCLERASGLRNGGGACDAPMHRRRRGVGCRPGPPWWLCRPVTRCRVAGSARRRAGVATRRRPEHRIDRRTHEGPSPTGCDRPMGVETCDPRNRRCCYPRDQRFATLARAASATPCRRICDPCQRPFATRICQPAWWCCYPVRQALPPRDLALLPGAAAAVCDPAHQPAPPAEGLAVTMLTLAWRARCATRARPSPGGHKPEPDIDAPRQRRDQRDAERR